MTEVTAETEQGESLSIISESTLGALDSLMAKIVEASSIVTQKLIDVSPAVAEGFLNLVQFKGIFELLIGFLLTIIPVFIMLFCLKKIKEVMKNEEDKIFLSFLTTSICGIVIISTALATGILFFETWLQAIFPEGYIGLRALEELGLKL